MLPDNTVGRSTAGDILSVVSTSACVTDSLAELLVSSADWSALTNVACLMGGVGRSFLLEEAAGWLADEEDLALATDSLRARTASARRFTLPSTTLDCVVVAGFFSAADCPSRFTRDVLQGTVVVDAATTRLDAFWAVLLFADVGLLVTGLTTAGLLDAVSALLGLLTADTLTATGLVLTALDGRVVV